MAELTPSCKAPLVVLFPVRVKSVLSAPVPLYAREIESAWFDHTEKASQLQPSGRKGRTYYCETYSLSLQNSPCPRFPGGLLPLLAAESGSISPRSIVQRWSYLKCPCNSCGQLRSAADWARGSTYYHKNI